MTYFCLNRPLLCLAISLYMALFLAVPAYALDSTDKQLADMVQLDQENQTWLGELTILDGRMIAVMGLYRAGKIDDALIQLDMALDMSRGLAREFAAHGGDDSTHIMEKMAATIATKAHLDILAEQYAEWRNGLLGTRFQTPYSLGTQLRAVGHAVKKASEIYQKSLSPEGDDIGQIADYHTAFGIVQAAKQVIQLYRSEATTPEQQTIFENINVALVHLDILLPGLVLPKDLHIDADGFRDIADRIGMKALTLR